MNARTNESGIELHALLNQALPPDHLPPNLVAPHEMAGGLSMLFSGLSKLYPQEVLWPALASRAQAVESATQAERLRDGSRQDPLHFNAFWGQTEKYPACAALTATQLPEHRPVTSILLAMALAQIVAPRLASMERRMPSNSNGESGVASLDHATRKVLGLLKKPLDATLAERIGHDLQTHLLWSDSGPQVFLEDPLPCPTGSKGWGDLYQSINYLIRNLPLPRANAAPAPRAPGEEDRLQTIYELDAPVTDDHVGLAPEDCGEHSFVLELLDLPPQDDATCVRRLNIGHGLLCCAPPLEWGVLPPSEGRVLAQSIRAEMEVHCSQGGSVLGALTLITGIPTGILMDMPIVPDLQALLGGSVPEHPALAWWDDKLFACIPIEPPPRAFERDSDTAGQHRHTSYAVLGIPTALALLVRRQLPGAAGTLRAAFPDADGQWIKSLPELRDRLGIAVTPGRVRQLVSREVHRLTQSMWMGSAAQPFSSIARLVLAHYAALPVAQLHDLHRTACSSLLGEAMTPPPLDEPLRSLLPCWIGSQLIPNIDEWALHLGSKFNQVQALASQQATSIEQSVECANAITRLVTHCLRLGTGARPHEGIFNLPQDLDLELHLAQLAEKQSNQRDTTRLCPLAPVLCELEQTRRQMVRWLADILSEVDEGLAGRLLSTLGGHAAYPSAPTLFILRKKRRRWHAVPMNGDEESALWDRPFPLPRNANRGALVQYLLGQGVREEAVRALLGHSDSAGTIADPNCPFAPASLFDELRPHLSTFLARLGVKPLNWPHEKTPKSKNEIAIVTSPKPLYGDFDPRRICNRAKTRLRHQRIYSTFREIGLSRLPGELIIQSLRKVLAENFRDEPEQGKLALQMIERRFAKLPSRKLEDIFRSEAKVRKQLLLVIEHPTPYQREEVRSIKLGGELRDAALGHLLSGWQAALTAGPTAAQAHLLLAAMATGALLAPDAADRFRKALPNLHVDGDTVSMEYTENDDCWRWVADDLTATLLVSYHAKYGNRSAATGSQILGAFDRLLESLGGAHQPPAEGSKSRLRWFQSNLLAWFRHHVPGTLLSHADHSRPSTPLPRTALARQRGHYVVIDPEKPFRSRCAIKAPGLPTRKQVDSAIVLLCRDLGEIDRSLNPRQIALLRKELQSLAKPNNERGSQDLSLAGELFIRFVYSLRTQGGRIKSVLADATISAYLAPVRALFSKMPGDAILDLDAGEREMAYREAYLAGGVSERSRRLLALQMFDEVLQDTYGTEPVVWSVVTAGAGGTTARIDANVIWPHERTLAAALLRQGPVETSADREAAELLLHLMAATGTRFSEAFYLLARDIQHDEGFVLIRPNRLNTRLKSYAAKRRIPLAERMTPRGLELLRKFLAAARTRNPGKSDTPLFAGPSSPRHMMNRANLQSMLSQALRLATGDPGVRPHHLRHTWAFETYDLWVAAPCGSHGDAQRSSRRELFGTDLPTRRAVAQWALALGHADMETGHRVYLHGQEFRVARATSMLLPRLGRKELDKLLGPATGAAGTATLRSALRRISKGVETLAPWRGLVTGNPPREFPHDDISPFEITWPDADRLHVILTHPAKRRLTTEGFAALFGMPPAMMAALVDAEREVYQSSLHFRGQLPAGISCPGPSQFRTYQSARHVPTGWCNLTGRTGIDALPATWEFEEQAWAVIELWRWRDRRADRAHSEKSLLDAVRWHLAMGVARSKLKLQVPNATWKRWCQAQEMLQGIAITTGHPIPPKRQALRLRVYAKGPDGRPINAAAAYLAQLWLVRARAIALHARA